jgi:phospholipid/cholesterol/gamma-HCH transport system substrate-binding protein
MSMADITIRISDKALKIVAALVSAAFLIWGCTYLWTSGALRPKYQILAFVPEAEGIRAGTPVLLDGLPVGSVSRMDLAENSANADRRIEIVLRIEKRFQNLIRDDSTASFKREGILGDSFVAIQRGFTGAPIPSGGEIRFVPLKQANLSGILGAIEKAAGDQGEPKPSPEPGSSTGKKPMRKSP